MRLRCPGPPGARVSSGAVGALDRLGSLDDKLGDALRRRQEPGWTRAAHTVTHCGSWVVQVGVPAVAVAAAARGGSRRTAAFAATSMLGTSAIFHGVKHIVQRERPHADWHLVATSDSSFPSGHAATAAAAARVLAEVTGIPKPPLATLALVVGATRVYLGVHHPSDVLGGFLIGWAWASAAARALGAGRGIEADGDLGGDQVGPLGYTDVQWTRIAAAKAAGAGHPVSGG